MKIGGIRLKNSLANLNYINENDPTIINQFKNLFLDLINRSAFYQMIKRTRNYEACLLLCNNFDHILNHNKSKFTEKEFAEIDQDIIHLRLMCLDSTDRWNKYIEYFEEIFKTRKYYLTYSADCDITRFSRYYLRTQNNLHHIHFLYSGDRRYKLIQRKIAKSLKSNKLGNLKHHPQSELTDAEIERRYLEVLRWTANLKKMQS